MRQAPLPKSAAWRHLEARTGFEVLFIEEWGGGWRFRGQTAAIEDGQIWTVGYEIDVDDNWCTRGAHVIGRSVFGETVRTIEADGQGHWRAEGSAVGELDGCLDLDLESSAFTNSLPVRRLQLAPGSSGQAPAAYLRAAGLQLGRLEQCYQRVAGDGPTQRYEYLSPSFDFHCEVSYDRTGLVLSYPGLAIRAG